MTEKARVTAKPEVKSENSVYHALSPLSSQSTHSPFRTRPLIIRELSGLKDEDRTSRSLQEPGSSIPEGHNFSRVRIHPKGAVHTPPIQTKLRINKPGDVYEEEADRVADAVMRMPEPGVRRQVEEKKEEEEEPLQIKENPSQTTEVTSNLESRINSLKGGGQLLQESVGNFFESRFGHNFSHVRIHNNTEAARMARSLNAKAFTTGRDIFFGTGQYAPKTQKGKNLLAHELVHVLQQAGRHVRNKSINCNERENTEDEDSLALKDINRGNEARNKGSSGIHRSLIFEKIQTSKSLMKQTTSKESKLKKLKINVEELPDNLLVCIPVAEKFLDLVWNDYIRWFYGVRYQTKTDYLRRSAAFWKKPENMQFDPLRHKGCKLVIQKLLQEKFSREYIEELRDVYSDHEMRGKTQSLWIISKVLGVKNLKVGFHPYEIKIFDEGGFGFLFISQQEARVGIRKWNKDKTRIIWQGDFLFHISTVNLGLSLKFSPPISVKKGKKIMKPVCFDMKESNVSYSGDSGWKPFESRIGWSPDDFKNATISVVSGPSAEAVIIEGKLDTSVSLCHSRRGCIKLPADKIDIKPTGLGVKAVEVGTGIVTGGFIPLEFCDLNQIISEKDIEAFKWMAREELSLLHRAGEWQLTKSQRIQLKNWLLSDPINGFLRAPASELKIIGYTSPFWATANTYEEMMRENKHLSFMRSLAVSNFVEDTMKDALVADVYMFHVGCEEYIKHFGRPRNFRINRREYRVFQGVDLILNDNLVFTVEF